MPWQRLPIGLWPHKTKKSGDFSLALLVTYDWEKSIGLTYRYLLLESQRTPARHSSLQVIGYSVCYNYNDASSSFSLNC